MIGSSKCRSDIRICGTIFLYTACESKSSSAKVCSADGRYTGYVTDLQKRMSGWCSKNKNNVTCILEHVLCRVAIPYHLPQKQKKVLHEIPGSIISTLRERRHGREREVSNRRMHAHWIDRVRSTHVHCQARMHTLLSTYMLQAAYRRTADRGRFGNHGQVDGPAVRKTLLLFFVFCV